jgi:predicted nucleic acid-binding protein
MHGSKKSCAGGSGNELVARYLLDSDCLIDYLTGVPASVSLVRRLFNEGEQLCLCEVVIAEVWAGLRDTGESEALALTQAMDFLLTSPEIARQAGRWRFEYARRGIALSTTDVLVAATAIAHNATLITGNVRHFPMPELSLLSLPR